MSADPLLAPELDVAGWLNAREPLSLARLRGRVVVIEACPMRGPGCVQHGLPQAQRVSASFRDADVQVVGLHAVFEHHDVQGRREALEAFLHEYRIGFPVAIDRPTGRIPATMAAYDMAGTPTLVLIDHAGRRRAQHFGQVSDLHLGAEIGQLLVEARAAAAARAATAEVGAATTAAAACTDERCEVR
ncbi:MAG: redoxin domain-containing protein [Pseudomonadota bacterium]